MSMKTGRLAGCPVRAYRISFSGELSFELATPAGYGRALWDAILEAGREFGIEVYGTEALHVLRAEKGFIAIGDETDGTVTPDDVGPRLGGRQEEARLPGQAVARPGVPARSGPQATGGPPDRRSR